MDTSLSEVGSVTYLGWVFFIRRHTVGFFGDFAFFLGEKYLLGVNCSPFSEVLESFHTSFWHGKPLKHQKQKKNREKCVYFLNGIVNRA